MDRASLEEELKRAERLVSNAEQNVARQRAFVDSLNPKTLAAKYGRELLTQFEESLAVRVAVRDRLQKELGSPPATSGAESVSNANTSETGSDSIGSR
jgi:hypothetical protein